MERSTPAADGGVPPGHRDDQDEADQEPVAPEEAREGMQPHPLCCTVFLMLYTCKDFYPSVNHGTFFWLGIVDN